MVHCLTATEIVQIHNELVAIFEQEGEPIEPNGPRDIGLVESAAARPFVALGVTEKYRTIDMKAAALFHSLVMNHAFHNGNKRTALVSLLVFLDRNDRLLEVTDDALFDFVLSVAENRLKSQTATGHADEVVEAIKSWISAHTTTRDSRSGPMKVSDFLAAVKAAGGSFRTAGKGGTWIVSGKYGKNIRISQSTSELDGGVIRRYLSQINLSRGKTGIHLDEFLKGVNPSQAAIRRFRNVLKKLATA